MNILGLRFWYLLERILICFWEVTWNCLNPGSRLEVPLGHPGHGIKLQIHRISGLWLVHFWFTLTVRLQSFEFLALKWDVVVHQTPPTLY